MARAATANKTAKRRAPFLYMNFLLMASSCLVGPALQLAYCCVAENDFDVAITRPFELTAWTSKTLELPFTFSWVSKPVLSPLATTVMSLLLVPARTLHDVSCVAPF